MTSSSLRPKKKRGPEEVYGTDHQLQSQPQLQFQREGKRHHYHAKNETTIQHQRTTPSSTSKVSATPAPALTPAPYVSPYNSPKTLLSQEEIALLVLSNNFLSTIAPQDLETDRWLKGSYHEAFQSSYALERYFLEHYVSEPPLLSSLLRSRVD